jgi:Ricin-type beta-trefoil lectin domain-like
MMSVAGGACATQVSTGCEGLNHIAAGCFMRACCSLANKRLAALLTETKVNPTLQNHANAVITSCTLMASMMQLIGCAADVAGTQSPDIVSGIAGVAGTGSSVQNGHLVLNDRAVFPFGFWTSAGGADNIETSVRKLVDNGFDFAFSGFGTSNENVARFSGLLDYAANAGRSAMFSMTGYAADDPLFLNPDIRANAGLLSWYHTDDANNFSVQDVQNRDQAVKNIDSHHITTISAAGTVDYAGVSDAPGYQSYPIGGGFEGALPRLVFNDTIRHQDAAAAAGRATISHLQTFTWSEYGKPEGRWPTAAELDVMTYCAVLAGTKGIYYYEFDRASVSGESLDQRQPALWEKAKQVRGEIRQIETALVLGTATRATADDGLFYGTWQLDNKTYVIAVNSTEDERAVNIAISSPDVTSMFGSRAASLSVSGSSLVGTLPAMSVEIYSTTGAAPPAPTIGDQVALKMQHSGQYLAIARASSNSGAEVVQWPYIDQPNFKWTTIDAGNGAVYLKQSNSNQYMAVDGSIAADNGTIVRQIGTGSSDNYRWYLQDAGDGAVYLTSATTSGRTAAIGRRPDGTNLDNGAPLVLWDRYDSPNFKVIVEKVHMPVLIKVDNAARLSL